MTFDLTTTTNLPDITTGYSSVRSINGVPTDMVTIMTVDAFMPTIETPPTGDDGSRTRARSRRRRHR